MSKQFVLNRHTTPATPTLDAVQESKEKVYTDLAAAEADIANIAENEFVDTLDEEVIKEGDIATKDYVDTNISNTLEWTYVGRIFVNNGTVNVPKTAREITMAISNTGSTLTASTISLPIRSILATSGSDEQISAWIGIGGTAGNFTVSGDNIVVKVTTIASSYVRVWYR